MLRKKLWVLLALVVVLSASMQVQPRRAEAVIGAATGGMGWVVAGAVIGVLGIAATNAPSVLENYPSTRKYAEPSFWAGIAAEALGILLLDEQGQPVVAFSPLDPPAAARLGLSPAELDAFNGSLDELNAVVQSVSADAARSGDASSAYIQARLDDYSAGLDAEALSAARKVAASAISRSGP